MLVTLRSQSTITADLPCTVSWSDAAGQSFGEATIRILRDSPAWSDQIVNEQGGMLVRVTTGVGEWIGIADAPEWRTDGLAVKAMHLNAWARIRHVASYRAFCGLSGGAIAKRAVQDALVGLGSVPVTIGSVLEAPPIIPVYQFKGQTLLSVLTDLQNQTGQVWGITNDLDFTWRKQFGRYREVALIDDGRFLSRLQRTPLADRIAEEIEIERSGRTFTAHDHSVPALWPSQRITRL